MFKEVKPQIRILGIDDGPFSREDAQVQVIGTVFRAGEYMDGMLSTYVTVDGIDATANLISMIKTSRTRDQLRLVMLDGIALGGFNVVNVQTLNKETGLPVIVVIRDMPDFQAIKKALVYLPDGEKRLGVMEKAGEIYKHEVSNQTTKGKIYYQIAGMPREVARKVLTLTIRHGLMPEPIRVAHIIGQGLKFGESKGRA